MPSEKKDTAIERGASLGTKAAIFFLIAVLTTFAYMQWGSLFSIRNLAQQELRLKSLHQNHPALVYGAAFTTYVALTALPLPGAVALSLVYGWFFGWVRGVVLVSFASTSGATLAFLLSRFLFREAFQRKFGSRLASFNRALEKEGAFYLFSLRLIPAVPFFVINSVMGLTTMRTTTFWWVSQLGMFAGTIVYVYAGSRVPNLQTLADKGIASVFSPRQLAQILIAFTLLGIFPLIVRFVMKLITASGNRKKDALQQD